MTVRQQLVCIALAAAAAGCSRGTAGSTSTTAAPVACNPRALSPVEREESARLLGELGKAVAGVEELPDGYSMRIDPARFAPTSLFRWVDLERKCCPFFRFGIELSSNSASTSLQLTGSSEVKELIRSKLGT